jgi:ABC-type phosphate transport system permease subunit
MLQTRTNEFIGHATLARVELPGTVYETNAELLRLPDRLRELARRAAGKPLEDVTAYDD